MGELESFRERIDAFRYQDIDRITCLEELLNALDDARIKRDALEGDLDSERTSRQQFQLRARELETNLSVLQTSVKKSAFVLVLIDADHEGYLFRDEYINRGAEGGKAAARELQKVVRTKLSAKNIDDSVPVVIRAFANTEALSKIFGDGNIGNATVELARFVQGFNQVKFCDFVSVGSGKDKADEKIKALFEHARGDPTCLHVVFGACHDNGYVRMLEQVDEPEDLDSITLLKSFQTGREFTSLRFPCMEIDGLFRTHSLRIIRSPADPREAIHNVTRHLNDNKSLELVTYASMASGSSQLSPDRDGNSGSVIQNKLGMRLDQRLPPCDPRARLGYRKKLQSSRRFCKDHFLAGQCLHNPCNFEHTGLSEEEVKVCRMDMRGSPCKAGLHCKNPSCFYGHHCPQDDCDGESCKMGFAVDMHNVFGY